MRASGPAGVAVVGLGTSEIGKVFGTSPSALAAEAVRKAAFDAGLSLEDIDGLLVGGGSRSADPPRCTLAQMLDLRNLRLLAETQVYGATAGAMVQHASLAISAGTATMVACVFADAPLTEAGGSAWSRQRDVAGFVSYEQASGFTAPAAYYALAARRHMQHFGTTSEDLGAVAVAQRAWAVHNPVAQMRTPITLADHQGSRLVAEPLRLLDCCLVSNGAVAVIVAAADRSRDLRQPPVYVWGFGQAHPGRVMERGSRFGLTSGAAVAGPAAFAMAGVTPADVDACQLYDCYTYTVLLTLEGYGFCPKGEGGPFVATGALGPGGALPTNTGGGQLSAYYLGGMTPLSEAIIQARGHGGPRQLPRRDVTVVSGNGGVLDYHTTLVLSPLRPGQRRP